jgi:hypothetical protein
MPRNTHAQSHPRSGASDERAEMPLRAMRPPRHDANTVPMASLEELAASLLISPDDVPLEIEDLAPHFLFEATQSSMPSSAASAGPPTVYGKDAALQEAFFESDEEREGEQLREFERIWKHIISRELISTEL